MAAFCVNCGSPLASGARFCEKCGTAAAGPPIPVATTPAPVASAPVAGAPSAAPAPTSQGSSAAVKIIFIVLAVFVFLALLVAGSCAYVAYRIKQKAHQYSQSLGGNVAPYTGSRVPCSKLSTDEASTAIGQRVVSFAQRGLSVCEYNFGPGGTHHVDVEYTWQGGAIAMGLAHAALKNVPGMDPLTSAPGLGDEALVGMEGSSLMMRKGDVMVTINLRPDGVTPDQAVAMARTIAGHL